MLQKQTEITIPFRVLERDGSEHRYVAKALESKFGPKVIVTGVDPSAIGTRRTRTFGVPLARLGKDNLRDDDPLTYASDGNLVIYREDCLRELENCEYEIENPEEAVAGVVKLKYCA
ncbi:MAG: hypothetical protein AABY16_00040 [Nanoarchaeota archaeon]